MKKPSKIITSLVAGVAVTGSIATSCSDSLYDNSFEINEDSSDKGIPAIDLSFTEEDLSYLAFLDKLGNDIIDNPVIAREFAQNPNLFVEKYGYNEKIDLEENLLKLILALGNDDINDAVKEGDTKKVLELMKVQNLLNADSYTKIIVSEEKRQEILSLMGIDEANFDQYGACTVAAVCIAYVFVGAASIAVAAASVAATINAAVYAALWLWTEAYGQAQELDNSTFLDNHAALRIWNLKGESQKTFVAVDMYLQEEVDKIVDGIEAVDNKAFSKDISKEQFREFVKLNILKQREESLKE